MSSSVEQIKEKLDIADIIGSYLKLEKAGGNFKAKCPFHNEKTPSFFVSPSRGTYYCFGCGAKGDIFSFIQEFEGMSFPDALKMLADKAGVVLEKTNPKERGEFDRLREILEMACVFFESNLSENKKAVEYLHSRGLQDSTIKEWRLGYVRNEWRTLYSYLFERGVSQEEMEKVGLIKRNAESKDGVYDVFRGRIMFPIFDSNGKVIAFSGRIFDDVPDAPKYLNTPETVLFNKSETLYGFDKAKISIRKKDYSILVEGQMDLLMCHQAGFNNAVATSGTAFTQGHLSKLSRLSPKILFVFDSDSAGFNAANKSAILALSMGMEVKLAELPKGLDPADLIAKDPDGWKSSLKNSKHLIDFYLDNLLSEKLESRRLAKEVEKKVLPLIVGLPSSIEQSHFVSQVAKKTGIREESIWSDLRKLLIEKKTDDRFVKEKVEVDTELKKRKNYIVRRLVGILFWKDGESVKTIDTDQLKKTLDAITENGFSDNLMLSHAKERDELIFEAESYYSTQSDLQKEIEELLMNFEEDVLRERFVMLMAELDSAEKKKDEKLSAEILKKCQEITKKISDLSAKKFQ